MYVLVTTVNGKKNVTYGRNWNGKILNYKKSWKK